jgi:DNA polymerase-3 subunit beta
MSNAIDLSSVDVERATTCSQSDLARAIDMVRTVDAKSQLEVLGNVLIAANGYGLRVTMTDLSTIVSVDIPTTGAPFRACVPARALKERVKAIGKGPVKLAPFEACDLAIGPYVVRGITSEDFPSVEHLATNGARCIPADTLRTMLDRAFPCVSKDETRPFLNSALVEWGTDLRIFATDGHRLALETSTLASGQPIKASFLVSRHALASVRKAIAKRDGLVSVALAWTRDEDATRKHPDEVQPEVVGRVTFRIGPVTITTKAVDATFPPYEQVIPALDSGITIRLPRERFLDAIRTVQVAASALTGGVKLVVGANGMDLSATSPDNGSAFAVCSILDGHPTWTTIIGVNASYLVDALETLDSDDITFQYGPVKDDDPGNCSLDPMVIRSGDSVSVVMPMRV